MLVGCKGADGARAFLARFESAFERGADARPATVSLAYGIQPLAEAVRRAGDRARRSLGRRRDRRRPAACPGEARHEQRPVVARRPPSRAGRRSGGHAAVAQRARANGSFGHRRRARVRGPEQAEEAVEAGRRPGYTPERVLLESGAITPEQLSRALAERYGLDHIDLSEFPVDESAAGRPSRARRPPLPGSAGWLYRRRHPDRGGRRPADSLGLSDIAVMTKLPCARRWPRAVRSMGCSTRSRSWRTRLRPGPRRSER